MKKKLLLTTFAILTLGVVGSAMAQVNICGYEDDFYLQNPPAGLKLISYTDDGNSTINDFGSGNFGIKDKNCTTTHVQVVYGVDAAHTCTLNLVDNPWAKAVDFNSSCTGYQFSETGGAVSLGYGRYNLIFTPIAK